MNNSHLNDNKTKCDETLFFKPLFDQQSQKNAENNRKVNAQPDSFLEIQENQEWKSNILISHEMPGNALHIGLRHLTSFEERNLDNQGQKLCESFKEYVCWINRVNSQFDGSHPSFKLSELKWENVESLITDRLLLNEEEKKILIEGALKNTQAELMISEIIEQIPEVYYTAALSIVSSLIEEFKNSKLKGHYEDEVLDYVNQSYKTIAIKIHPRLVELGLTYESMKQNEKYLNFIKYWMQIFFLSLNGYLDITIQRRSPFEQIPNGICFNQFGRKQLKLN